MAINHVDLAFALRDFALRLASAMGKARGAVRTAETEMMREAFGEAEAAATELADWLRLAKLAKKLPRGRRTGSDRRIAQGGSRGGVRVQKDLSTRGSAVMGRLARGRDRTN